MDDIKHLRLDVIDLKRFNMLQPNRWSLWKTPTKHPSVAELRATRHRLDIQHHGGKVQLIHIRWRNPTGDAQHDSPKFVCSCGKGCRHLYPTAAGSYVCRHCVMGGAKPRMASDSRAKPKRMRSRPVQSSGPRRRDPVTGRFLPAPSAPKPKAPSTKAPEPVRWNRAQREWSPDPVTNIWAWR